jgi:hypothetical protein
MIVRGVMLQRWVLSPKKMGTSSHVAAAACCHNGLSDCKPQGTERPREPTQRQLRKEQTTMAIPNPGTRAQIYAERIEETNAALIALLEGCSSADWTAVGPHDARSVGVLAHHVASAYPFAAGLVTTLASGQPLPAVTMQMVHQLNAQQAAQYADYAKGETIDLLRTNGAAAATAIAELGDGQLERTSALALVGGHTVSADQVIEMLVLGHLREHLVSIRAALASVPRTPGGIGGI